VVTAAIRREAPFAVLVPATADGRDYAPRVAARLQLGLTGDCIDVTVDSSGALVQLKPAFGGNIIAPVYTRTRPAMATVRPGLLTAPVPLSTAAARIRGLEVPGTVLGLRLERFEPDRGVAAMELSQARVVVGVGRGV